MPEMKTLTIGDVTYEIVDETARNKEFVLYTPQSLTEAQKAQVRANIGATAGEDVEYADSVEWLNENGDTSKKYVLPDGFIYAWMGQTITTVHNANDGTCLLNKRTTKNVAMSADASTQNGNLMTPAIEVDNSWSECVLTISGISTLYPIYYAPLYIYYYAADGSYVMQMPAKQLGLTDNNEANLAIPADGLSVDLALPSYNGTTVWANTKYIRIVLGLSSGSALSTTSEAVKNLVINLEPLNQVATEYGWYSTGQQHSNDKATQQNSADIATLKERADTLEAGIGTLETAVEELRETVESGGLTAVQTGEVFYAVGDSITYGSGGTNYGTINGSWVKHVIARNGYDTTKSKNLGISGIGFKTNAPGQTIMLRDVIAANDFSRADVVTVAAGINDWKNLNVMLEDFFTEFKYCLTQIRTANPYCRIFYVLPFNMRFKSVASCTFANYYGLGYAGDSNALRCYGNTLKTFRNMIKDKFETDEDLKALNIHVIDITPINRNNIDSVTVDGLHPNDECYKRIGEMLAKIMDAT